MAFNHDPAVAGEVTRLIELFGVDHVVETGSWTGPTAVWFAKTFPNIRVDTVEIKEEFQAQAKAALAPYQNACSHLGSSHEKLGDMLDLGDGNGAKLAYLDAHWWDYLPLNDELHIIAKHAADNCIVVIDDFKVPQRNYQCDIFQDKPIDLSMVIEALNSTAPSGLVYYYLNKSQKGTFTSYDGTQKDGVGKLYAVPIKLLQKIKATPDKLRVFENNVPYSNAF
jgi:hypothetical protein